MTRSARPRRPRWTPTILALLLPAALALPAPPAAAEVVRVVVDRRELVLGGREWGEHGAYEKLVGRIFFEFDPRNPANAGIVDLDMAPRNADGRVEAWADFMVLQPRDPGLRRGLAWLEVSNRGGKASLRYFQHATGRAWDPTTEEDIGDGLLFRQGLTVIWVGWQWDVPEQEGRLRLHVPVARGSDGPIEGLVRADWVVDRAVDTLSLGHRGHRAYAPVSADHPNNILTVRSGRDAPRHVVPRERWRLVRGEADPEGRLTAVALDGGFEAGRIYEIVYRARDPRVVGLGLASIRDVMSYAKYGLESEFPANRGIAFGVSQTGRFLRHFLYQGFNVDEGGRKVFDGMLVHTAGAGRGSFNHRFAQPSRDAHRYSAFFYPTDLFPFASQILTDPETGRRDGLLEATPLESRPYVFYTNTGYEYWGRAASLIHTSPDGLTDVLPLPNERLYHLAGGQHFVGAFPPSDGVGDGTGEGSGPPVIQSNPVNFLLTLRALAVRLVEWVDAGTRPPPSMYPTLGEGSLVPPHGVAFPAIGTLTPPRAPHVAYRADFGPRFAPEGVITRQPPELGPSFPSLVPQVDGMGNELGGIRPVELRVPLATYTPWSVRGPEAPSNADELRDFTGTLVPLPRDAEERAAWNDSRPSIASLYGNRTDYMRRVVAALQDLVNQGLLLGEDAGRASSRAAQLWDWRMGAPRVGEPGGG